MKPTAAPAHFPYQHRSLAESPVLPASAGGQPIFVAILPSIGRIAVSPHQRELDRKTAWLRRRSQ